MGAGRKHPPTHTLSQKELTNRWAKLYVVKIFNREKTEHGKSLKKPFNAAFNLTQKVLLRTALSVAINLLCNFI